LALGEAASNEQPEFTSVNEDCEERSQQCLKAK